MTTAFINRIATKVPDYDFHGQFVDLTANSFEPRTAKLFRRMVDRAHISHRWTPVPHLFDDFYHGALSSVDLHTRMREFEIQAPKLAADAVRGLELGDEALEITHLIVVTCTGFYTPGIDFDIIETCGLNPSVERTQVAFMGCYAGVNGLKLAHHIVRSQPRAKVLVVALELCSLHLHSTQSLEQMLALTIFGDGCAAALITSRAAGVALDSFNAIVLPDTRDLMTLRVGTRSIEIFLSGKVPNALGRALKDTETMKTVLDGADKNTIATWAIHPGGRSILDAVGDALELDPAQLEISRHVLDNYGNLASATILFVFEEILRRSGGEFRDERGCALAFGPGLSAETLLYRA